MSANVGAAPPLVRDPAPVVNAFLARGGQVVTFDVFDTLLWRRVLFRVDAFRLLPHGRRVTALRAFAEAGATAWCRRVLRREPRLADIYRIYPFDPRAELALEAELAQPNPWCLAAVNELLARGVTVAAVSDMYLSAQQIGTLLQAAGYPRLPVFSSSEANRSKRGDGRLFLHVGEQIGAAPSSWLHVGDNLHADVEMARRHGLSACHVQAPRDTLLALLPNLQSRRRTPEEAVFLGELAIALHLRMVSTQALPQDVAERLTRLLAPAAGGRGQSVQATVEAALGTAASEARP